MRGMFAGDSDTASQLIGCFIDIVEKRIYARDFERIRSPLEWRALAGAAAPCPLYCLNHEESTGPG